jgi:hypothetical protein
VRHFLILSPMRNNGMRATLSERDGKFLIDVEDSSEEPVDSGHWETTWENVYTGQFSTAEARQIYWDGFVKGVELIDCNAEVREVESFDEDEPDESDD